MKRPGRFASAAVATCGSLALGLAMSAPAQAAQPTVEHFTSASSYTLSSASDIGCSGPDFTIQVVGTDTVTTQTFFDKSGAMTKAMVHDHFVGTESANGVTLRATEDATITDYPSGVETWVGQPLRVSLPNGTSVIFDAGKLVYAADGSITVVHGPHPFATADPAALDAYCAAFA